jgi:hypothetical protein
MYSKNGESEIGKVMEMMQSEEITKLDRLMELNRINADDF